jgi:hypothetical protein
MIVVLVVRVVQQWVSRVVQRPVFFQQLCFDTIHQVRFKYKKTIQPTSVVGSSVVLSFIAFSLVMAFSTAAVSFRLF